MVAFRTTRRVRSTRGSRPSDQSAVSSIRTSLSTASVWRGRGHRRQRPEVGFGGRGCFALLGTGEGAGHEEGGGDGDDHRDGGGQVVGVGEGVRGPLHESGSGV